MLENMSIYEENKMLVVCGAVLVLWISCFVIGFILGLI